MCVKSALRNDDFAPDAKEQKFRASQGGGHATVVADAGHVSCPAGGANPRSNPITLQRYERHPHYSQRLLVHDDRERVRVLQLRSNNRGDCDGWHIQCPSNKYAMLTFTEFQTEHNFDYVYVFSGSDFSTASTDAVAIESGSGIPSPSSVTADSPNMIVVFDTDSSSLGNGWTASARCVTSPGPVSGDCWEAYTPNYRCSGYSSYDGVRVGWWA